MKVEPNVILLLFLQMLMSEKLDNGIIFAIYAVENITIVESHSSESLIEHFLFIFNFFRNIVFSQIR